MIYRVLLLGIVLLGLWGTGCAQEGAEVSLRDEAAFFAEVNETGGYVTEKLHQAFWEFMRGQYDDNTRDMMVTNTLETLGILKDFQKATWESAKLSYFSQQLEKTGDYETLMGRLGSRGSHYFSPRVIITQADQIIAAAASRQALDLGGGKFYVTPELIEENLLGIQGAFERLMLLMTPQWAPEYKEYKLPMLKISLLAWYAPDQYHETVVHHDESIDLDIAQLNTDKNTTYEIGSVNYKKGDRHFCDFSMQEKEIYIQEFVRGQFLRYRIEAPILSQGTWRGYSFVKGAGSVSDFNVVLMGMIIQDKAFYVKLVTMEPLPFANEDFSEFMKRIQVAA